jgi:energy-coupling factor transport system ATP-binding protein
VAIASILCMGPGVLVLDEPTAHLDPSGAKAVADLLVNRAAAGTAVLVAEHRHAVLARAGRVAVLDAGRLVADAPASQALGPAVAGPAGVAVPAVLRVAAAIGVDPAAAADEAMLAAAIARGVARPAAVAPSPGPDRPRLTWNPVRAQPPTGFRLEGLAHRYPNGVTGLDGIDLRVEPGETVAIVGRNGSGKTTLARHLAGFLAPSEGRVRVGEADVAGRPISETARTVGFVFADPDGQLFSRSVEIEVAFGPRNLGLGAARVGPLVDQALLVTGLDERRPANPHDLVDPDRRMVAVASILAMDPALLVMDEPTAGQDAAGTARVGTIVGALASAGRTVVAVSHDTEFVAAHFRRVVVMERGRIVADGPPEVVFAPSNAPLLAEAGLEPPPIARLAGRLGLEPPVPLTVEGLLRRVATSSP